MRKSMKTMMMAAAMMMTLGVTACQKGEEAPEKPPTATASEGMKKEQLTLLAAASLTNALEEIKERYEKQNPDVELVISYGGSGALAKQIESGAPADLFFSAGKKQMEELVEKDLMDPKSVQNLLENKIVLIAPKGQTLVRSFEDLKKPEVTKIGIGDPATVPVGQYTQEIYHNLGLEDAVKDKLVIASDVRQVLSWVETGNVEAGTVYETDAKSTDKVEVLASAPSGSHKPIVYPAGIVKATKLPEKAAKFMAYLTTLEAADLFLEYGFAPLKGQ